MRASDQLAQKVRRATQKRRRGGPSGTGVFALDYGELLSKGEDFEAEGVTRTEEAAQIGEEE